MPPYVNNPDKITYFAETDYRSKRIKFGIRDDDRARHMYVIGKTGMGKSTLLENLAIQDIQNGEGVCFIDPHGGTAETLLSYVPESRIKDVIYFAPFDQEFPVGLNVMEDMGRDKRPLVVSGLMGAFKKVWADAWSARMEYILNNTMLALMETPGSTLLGVNRMYADKDYRAMIVANVTDPSVRAFWVDEYAKYSEKFATEATAAIQNKVGQFAANPLIRNLVGQPKSTFDIRQVMDERKIFIVNLSKGRMGEGNANLVGSMLITKIYLAAMSRADVGPEVVKGLPPFYLYVDEFQSFANESFADILSEARKYKLSLTIAHQYIEQMSDEVRAAVFGNVGTMISFRVGSYDAEVLEKEFAPVFLAEDMVNLGFAQVYMKLMIRGIGSPPFSATTLNRPAFPARNFAKEVLEASHAQFALPRAQIEEDIRKWHEPVPPQPRDPNAPPETKKYAPGMRPTGAPRPQSFTPSAPPQTFTPSFAPDGTPLATPAVPRAPYAPVTPMVATGNPATPVATVRPVEAMREVTYTPPPPEPTPAIQQFSPAPEYVAPKVFTPTPQVAPPTGVPPPEKTFARSAMHQPFKQSLATLKAETPETSRGTDVGAPQIQQKFVHTERLKPKNEDALSLNILKSQPKKDKGPTEANLSSLKEALSAVMAKPIVRTDSPSQPEKPLPQNSQFVPTPPTLKVVLPVANSLPTPSPALLGDVSTTPSTVEVPEDVLRSILSD